ncbi:MAG: phosphodiester glycosidase family protein [Thermosynechococcaceae cyanobacterium]
MSRTLSRSAAILTPLRGWLFLPMLLLTACNHGLPQASSAPLPQHEAQVQYKQYERPHATLHVLTIPNTPRYRLTVASSDQLMTVDRFAQKDAALAALNGGFFDPINQKTTSYITIDGAQIATPSENERLVKNPKLGPYLDKILNRSEFRQYQCGERIRYDIQFHQADVPEGCNLMTALGAGPRLLPTPTLAEEAFLDSANGVITRDPLGSRQRNARSAIGLTVKGNLLWVMAGQNTRLSQPTGMTLAELEAFMKELGAVQAMNLDGGTSSTLVYQDQVYAGKSDASGQPILRPVKSVLLLQENQEQDSR